MPSALIADTLKNQKEKYGPESLGILSPARRTYSEYLYRFLMAHGSPNYGHSGICAMQMGFTFSYTVGDWPRMVDYGNSDLILVWGKQPDLFRSRPRTASGLTSTRRRGARSLSP